MDLTGVAKTALELTIRSAQERHGRIEADLRRLREAAQRQHEAVDADLQADLRKLAADVGLVVPDGHLVSVQGATLGVVDPTPEPPPPPAEPPKRTRKKRTRKKPS